jgi:hypothetical protein
VLACWWVSEFFSDRLFYGRARRGPRFFSDRFLDRTFSRVVFKPIICVLIDGLLNFLLDVFCLVEFFILCIFNISLTKIRRFYNIFIKKLFQFVFSLSSFPFNFRRFLLDWFWVGISKRDTLFGFGAFFKNGWKNGIVVIKWKFSIICLPLLFEGDILLNRFVSGLDLRGFIEGNEGVINFLGFLEIGS